MAHVEPLPRETVREFEEAFRPLEERMGFLPNSVLTMARKPDLLKAFSALGRAVYAPTENVPLSLKNMVAHVASAAAGCRYCMAHTASNANRPAGKVEEEKIERLWNFEVDPVFSEKERVTLSFAAAAASVPNLAEPEHFEALRRFYTDDDIVEIVSVIAYFGFLNRWNDTMATDLEPIPLGVGAAQLKDGGWTPGKHAAQGAKAR
ncbi:MAG TPA: carboxymuconolactone decarboxylase family protein [Dehalococcoidia bacterium]